MNIKTGFLQYGFKPKGNSCGKILSSIRDTLFLYELQT